MEKKFLVVSGFIAGIMVGKNWPKIRIFLANSFKAIREGFEKAKAAPRTSK
ncbi:MAG: hypothetical protein RAO92_04585 [Candidatus Euphemobacter frigidus]|nr:hypothetical protein [Candidatus Euphemobacter frigidus]MDP8275664.1 hypothetical protein [Candidatus Euphemobacter frigidus]